MYCCTAYSGLDRTGNHLVPVDAEQSDADPVSCCVVEQVTITVCDPLSKFWPPLWAVVVQVPGNVAGDAFDILLPGQVGPVLLSFDLFPVLLCVLFPSTGRSDLLQGFDDGPGVFDQLQAQDPVVPVQIARPTVQDGQQVARSDRQ